MRKIRALNPYLSMPYLGRRRDPPYGKNDLLFFHKPGSSLNWLHTEGQRVLKVLIVEDDLMMADFLEEILIDHGYEVSGIARTVDAAVALAKHSNPNLLILDMRLADGGLGTEVAGQLSPPGRPGILYATGNMSQIALTSADGEACLSKPYRAVDLLRSLEIVAGIVATGKAHPPFPPGFQLLHPAANKSQAVGI